jgi:hypothetical protein
VHIKPSSSTGPVGDPARSEEDQPPDPDAEVAIDEVRTRRLVVVDEAGEERIVATVDRGLATLQVLVAGCPDGEETMVDISASDDPEFGPSIGVHLCARGDEVAVFTAWRDDIGAWREGSGPWRAAVSGPAIDAALDEAG